VALISAWLPEAHFIFARAARVGLTIDQILMRASEALLLFFRHTSIARDLR
jgi:hypothetical protein